MQSNAESDIVSWDKFNNDFWSLPRRLDTIEEIVNENPHHIVPITKFMIEDPFFVFTRTNAKKAVLLFHEQSLRHLPCVDFESGKVEGIITRKEVVDFLEANNMGHV